jgi:hypothetical protein
MARENDVHRYMTLAFPEKDVAGPVRPALPIFAQQGSLRFIKDGKNLVPSIGNLGAGGGRRAGRSAHG